MPRLRIVGDLETPMSKLLLLLRIYFSLKRDALTLFVCVFVLELVIGFGKSFEIGLKFVLPEQEPNGDWFMACHHAIALHVGPLDRTEFPGHARLIGHPLFCLIGW